jgi:hypothetical protein
MADSKEMTRGLGGPRVVTDWRVREAEGGFCAPVCKVNGLGTTSFQTTTKKFLRSALVRLPQRRWEPSAPWQQNVDIMEENSASRIDYQPSSIRTNTTAKPTPATDSPPTIDDSQATRATPAKANSRVSSAIFPSRFKTGR